MTSTLFKVSIGSPRAARRPLLLRFLDEFRYDLWIPFVPLGRLHELSALDLPYLNPATPLVVGRGDLEWGNQPAEGEALDLLETLPHVLARDFPVLLRPKRVADRFEVQGRDQGAAIVIDGRGHLPARLLTLLLVHLADLLQYGVVLAHAGELEAAIAFGDAEPAGGLDVRLGGSPHERHDLRQGIPHPLELF